MSINNIQNVFTVQIGSTSEIDLQSLMMAVMLERSSLVEDQMRNQIATVQQKNNSLKNLNQLVSESGVNQSQANALDQTNQLSVTEANGKVTIKISDEYTIEIPKPNTNQDWTLIDKEGNRVKIWGDPHVDENADGRTDWDFKQDATFLLEDGTKISVGTAPWGNGDMTVTSSLTITRGDEAITVTGIDKNNVAYTDSDTAGREIDAKTNDGYIFREGAGGVDDWMATDKDGNPTTEIRSNQAMDRALQNEVKIETNDIEMSQELKDFLKANPKIPYTDSDEDGKLTASEYKMLMDTLGRERDSLTSSSQLDMTQLQMYSNKLDQTFGALTNLISKFSQTLSTIIGNLR